MTATSSEGEPAFDIAESHHWSVLRLRVTALVLTLATAVVAMRTDNRWLVLAMLVVLPMFWSADHRFSEMMTRNQPAPHGVGGGWQLDAAHRIRVPTHRSEFYLLLLLATMVVALR